MSRTLCLATQNPKKAGELETLLAPLGYTVRSLAALGIDAAPEENGESFMDNARIKARAACLATGLPSIADDSGLCVDALDGAPGIYSARFGGYSTDRERNEYLLRHMEKHDKRTARFVCALILCYPDGRELRAEGLCEGEILRAARGENGFGYDPLFWLPEQGKSMAELSAAGKDALSHRGKALRKLARLLEAGGGL